MSVVYDVFDVMRAGASHAHHLATSYLFGNSVLYPPDSGATRLIQPFWLPTGLLMVVDCAHFCRLPATSYYLRVNIHLLSSSTKGQREQLLMLPGADVREGGTMCARCQGVTGRNKRRAPKWTPVAGSYICSTCTSHFYRHRVRASQLPTWHMPAILAYPATAPCSSCYDLSVVAASACSRLLGVRHGL